MKSNDNKYYLSFDFRILYCPDIYLIGACRELNLDTLKFEPFTIDENILKYSYPIKANEINDLVKSVLIGEISYLLSDKNIIWIKEFEKKLKETKSILENDKLCFNYLTLKIMLLGFSKNKALDMTKTYFTYKREGNPVIELRKVIKAIDELLDNKKFWITNKIYEYETKEVAFLEKTFEARKRLGNKFDYRSFEREYITICNNSFSKENFKLNSQFTYGNKPKKSLQDQTTYILQSYEMIIVTLMNTIITTKYKSLIKDTRFLKSLLSDMKDTMSVVMSSWS